MAYSLLDIAYNKKSLPSSSSHPHFFENRLEYRMFHHHISNVRTNVAFNSIINYDFLNIFLNLLCFVKFVMAVHRTLRG